MKKINLYLLFLLIFTSACGDAGKILRNEKIRTTDEFLIKKKDPLMLPPDYKVIPSPDSINKVEKEKSNALKKILKTKKNNKIIKEKSSSVEDSIIRKIPK